MKARVTSARGLRTVLGLAGIACVPGAGQAFAASPAAASFDLVIQAPDDPAINLAYAESEANAGRLLNAAAALERVLLTRPVAHGVRLFYAVVLYRLDDLQGAKQQLNLLAKAPLTPIQAAERDRYVRLVNGNQKPAKIGGQFAAGFDYQSDALGELQSQFDLPGFHKRKAGMAGVVSGTLTGSAELNPGLDVYGSASGYSRNDVSGPRSELQSLGGQLGLAGTNVETAWRMGGVVRHYILFGDAFLTEYGGQGEANWRADTLTTITGRFEAVRQAYNEPALDALVKLGTLSGTHDGWRYNASLGAAYRLSASSVIGLTAGIEWKTASYRPFAYQAPYVQGNYRRLLGQGIYLDLTGRVMFADYRAADAVFLGPAPGVKRKSTRGDVRAVLGVPLAVLTGTETAGDAFRNVTIEGSLSYASRAERSPLADYESFGAGLRLVWRFGDGN